jgi:curved DNA-binding protein CbpA
MSAPRRDPYETLGVRSDVSDQQLRAVYRQLVQRHHPDHNGGSPEAARRFEEIQEAYQQIRQRREHAPPSQGTPPRPSQGPPPPPDVDPQVEARLADLERELREAQAARERARRAAQEASAASYKRPSDEALGYVKTDDSLSKILADARAELSGRLDQAREHPAGQRVADLVDQLAAKLTGEPPPGSRD